jgi:hypothetical protein
MNDHRLEPGDFVVFASVGAGMNINSMIYKMPDNRAAAGCQAFFLLYKTLDSPTPVEYRTWLLALDIIPNPIILWDLHHSRRRSQ